MKLEDLAVSVNIAIFEGSVLVDAAEILEIGLDEAGAIKTVKVKSLTDRPGDVSEFGREPGCKDWLLLTKDPFDDEKKTFSNNAPSYRFELAVQTE
jgi:hypothetical protein